MKRNKKKDFAFIIREGDVYRNTILLFLVLLPFIPWLFTVETTSSFVHPRGTLILALLVAFYSLLVLFVSKKSKRIILQMDTGGISLDINKHIYSLCWNEIESISIRSVIVMGDNRITNISWDKLKAINLTPIKIGGGKLQNVIFVKPIGKDELGLSISPYIFLWNISIRRIRTVVSKYKNACCLFTYDVPSYWKSFILGWSLLLKGKI